MMSVNAASITIERAYFDTLVRRAQFNAHALENEIPPALNVTISQAEHDSLKAIARKYENLRRNLLRGGVEDETVDLLSQDDAAIDESLGQAPSPVKREMVEDGGARLNTTTPQPQPSSSFFGQPRGPANGYHGNGYHSHGPRYQAPEANLEADDDEVSCDGDSPDEVPAGATYVKPQSQRQQYDRVCTRTIQLLNLGEGTTHADITNAVRGGMLLDVFLRSHERSATVSFLHAVDARKFFDHVRRHDLYIKNKRIDIKWSDRQFILPGHVAGKIAMGASRNLVIHRYDNRHTAENIREDLDHIHNLVVVKVEFFGGNCYVGLNSVHNAIYAKQCMMSRFKYKGTKIEWDVDECAQPYVLPQPRARREFAQQPKGPSVIRNRFDLLNIDGDEEDEIAATFQSKKSIGVAA
ncbi:hypothetical protein B0T19DRAFT_440531 [Cercophora scortea]|uniref:Negative regulator of differentiation 1 n=1 Tax=Cercophora scortea TaxID=314031 RepID=A0AAE0IYS9_9PEZI|nr:hypothetical protein B0T19DRAFT_440531 [Cercophora scortea]